MVSMSAETGVQQPARNRGGLVIAIALGLATGYVCALFAAYRSHLWLMDASGKPVVFDFVAFWSAGKLVLQGHALAAYTPHLQHAAEVSTVGHDFTTILGWSYPPAFLFVAGGLALLPFVPAFLVWIVSTLILYASVVRAIAKERAALLLALAPPWVLFETFNGQNGFLTAALVGSVLLALEEMPGVSGVLLGLLSIKPQFGVLFPIVLLAGGYWRTFIWAALTVAALTALTSLAFGPAATMDFIHGLSTAAQSHLARGGLAPNNMQSVFGLTRWMGVSESAAFLFQIATAIGAAAALIVLWRSSSEFALKAAGTVPAILLATPYVLVSDLVMLSIAIAFLHRQRELDRVEMIWIALACACVGLFLIHTWPVGLLADAMIAGLVWRRAQATALAGGRADAFAH